MRWFPTAPPDIVHGCSISWDASESRLNAFAIQELLGAPRRSEHGGPSGRLRHERTLSAAVHGPGEPGVTLIGVASAKLRSAESRTGRADATGLEVVLQLNGWEWRDGCWSPTAGVSSRVRVASCGRPSTICSIRRHPRQPDNRIPFQQLAARRKLTRTAGYGQQERRHCT
jgi:hypothetical protein